MPLIRPLLLTLALLATLPTEAACPAGSPLNTSAKRLLGPVEQLCDTYGGKVVLVVNTASQCGFTPQYEGLEKLHKKYGAQGFVVLGFPSDQFAGQEFDSEQEIQKFCKLNYGVSFPMFSKSDVRGSDANPLFAALIKSTDEAPMWNFYKYLIGRDGKPIEVYSSRTKPEDAKLAKAIETALAAKAP
ncbi:glutathione peroxidase [Solimonas sp. K1W22B-7]|uniref:glutathione peroxidase n=1 Tax=Solimonas sp. K1W22B-7 TaxID=2303331 RepID=UPI000E3360B0|nr:glutathione peroxidase [Solimonas sp. K1W22B-7]AXQ29698.1 glutathione peroxidase [Solimonas sp. K1W22B-7]